MEHATLALRCHSQHCLRVRVCVPTPHMAVPLSRGRGSIGSALTCKFFARAAPWAGPKGHPCGRLVSPSAFAQPALRLEGIGLLKIARVMLDAWIKYGRASVGMMCRVGNCACAGALLGCTKLVGKAHRMASCACTGIVQGRARHSHCLDCQTLPTIDIDLNPCSLGDQDAADLHSHKNRQLSKPREHLDVNGGQCWP